MIFQSVTPWGEAEALRDRMLSPGPGSPAADVARNQRERLFAATVAVVTDRGYAATRVGDLVEVSGVSRRSFYDLFADKSACLVATLKALHALAEAELQPPATGSWQERAAFMAQRLARLVAAQPAAARLCLIDGYGGGPVAAAELHRATARLSALLRRTGARPEVSLETSAEMADVLVGAMLTVARRCLLIGREVAAPDVMAQAMPLLLALEPPPGQLRPAPRQPVPAPETVDAPDHAERILRALVVLAAEQGYEKVTISQIVKRAAIAPSTFYANFRSKDEALMAALDSAGAQMVAAILPAFRRNPEWPLGVHAAFAALFGFLASRPALARLLLVEVYAAGPLALSHRGLTLRPLEVLFAEGRRNSPAIPAAAVDALEGGIIALATRRVLTEGPEAIPALTPLCTYLSLAPFIGPARAYAVADRELGRRPERSNAGMDRVAERSSLGQAVVDAVTLAPQALGEIARKVGRHEDEVARVLPRLVEGGLIEAVEDGGPPRYRSVMGQIGTPDWGSMSLAERNRISAQVGEMIDDDLRRAVEAGVFDARVERQLTRVVLQLDERGWRELSSAHDELLERERRIGRESTQRLAESGDLAIDARSIRMFFEMPDSDGYPG
jgi:AcrR family transcriptional regulator